MLYQGFRVHTENKMDTFDIFDCSDSGTVNNPYIQRYRIEGRTVPVIFCNKGINVFWKTHREGFFSIIRHILKIFRCKFSIVNYYNGDLYQPIISKLFDLQVEFKKLTIYFKGLSEDSLLWNPIATKLGLVEHLRIFSVAKLDFSPVFPSWPQEISILSSAWFTLETLLSCPCSFINLEDSTLENKDLDVILLKWKTGGFPNLENLKIHGQCISNTGITILGMNLRELDGLVIQTEDGSKEATIRSDSRWIEMSVTSFYQTKQ